MATCEMRDGKPLLGLDDKEISYLLRLLGDAAHRVVYGDGTTHVRLVDALEAAKAGEPTR